MTKRDLKSFVIPLFTIALDKKLFNDKQTTFIAVLIAPLKRVRRRIISVGSAKTVNAIFGSSVKCVDTFRIDLKEEPKSCVKQIDEGVSKLIHPLFVLPLPCLRHNSLFTAAMLLISYKMIYWALNSLYKLV